MNAVTEPKRRGRPPKVKPTFDGPKPSMPPLDPVEAQLEAGRLAIEGNGKLQVTVDQCRMLLQTIATAEYDHEARRPVLAEELRKMAHDFLALKGWARKPIITTRAGRADKDPNKMHQIGDYNGGA